MFNPLSYLKNPMVIIMLVAGGMMLLPKLMGTWCRCVCVCVWGGGGGGVAFACSCSCSYHTVACLLQEKRRWRR